MAKKQSEQEKPKVRSRSIKYAAASAGVGTGLQLGAMLMLKRFMKKNRKNMGGHGGGAVNSEATKKMVEWMRVHGRRKVEPIFGGNSITDKVGAYAIPFKGKHISATLGKGGQAVFRGSDVGPGVVAHEFGHLVRHSKKKGIMGWLDRRHRMGLMKQHRTGGRMATARPTSLKERAGFAGRLFNQGIHAPVEELRANYHARRMMKSAGVWKEHGGVVKDQVAFQGTALAGNALAHPVTIAGAAGTGAYIDRRKRKQRERQWALRNGQMRGQQRMR